MHANIVHVKGVRYLTEPDLEEAITWSQQESACDYVYNFTNCQV